MDFLSTFGQTTYPGQRLPRVKGYHAAKNYRTARDSEAVLIDEDNPDIVYFKKTDANGNDDTQGYNIIPIEEPEFDPTKYVSVEQFNKRMEKIENGIDSLTKSFAAKFGTEPESDSE